MWFKLILRDSAYKINGKLNHAHINLHHVQKVVFTPNVALKIAFSTGETLRLSNPEYNQKELSDAYQIVQQAILDHK